MKKVSSTVAGDYRKHKLSELPLMHFIRRFSQKTQYVTGAINWASVLCWKFMVAYYSNPKTFYHLASNIPSILSNSIKQVGVDLVLNSYI